MVDESSVQTPPQRSALPSPAAPLALWLLIQLLALALGALGIPLSDQWPRPPEKLSIELMLSFQLIFSSLLFDQLFRSPSQSLIILSAAWPFLAIAAPLSATPAPQTFLAAAYLTGWLALLGLGGVLLHTRRARQSFTAIASALAILGPILWYLRAEFHPSSEPIDPVFLGPLTTALSILHSHEITLFPWIPLSLALLLTIALISRQVLHRKSTPLRPPAC